jgi:hypothetical protein
MRCSRSSRTYEVRRYLALADCRVRWGSLVAESIRDAVRSAYPILLTNHVRLPVERAAALASELRSHGEA